MIRERNRDAALLEEVPVEQVVVAVDEEADTAIQMVHTPETEHLQTAMFSTPLTPSLAFVYPCPSLPSYGVPWTEESLWV